MIPKLDILFVIMFSVVVLSSAGDVTVSTNVGKIFGNTENVIADGKTKIISKFMNIPFAESTSAQSRFLKPIPKAPFDRTYMATSSPVGCYQSSVEKTKALSKLMNITEDCLILNIYVPHDFTGNVTLPVMVWIHGGGFKQGASGKFPADIVNAYANVIVVTINYRLGMFGFLQSADGNLPGNQGLWDQHLALKWVHENIAAFTGDPNLVTIFGESAGGASVLFQALYPGNEGYFQRVIAESGSCLAPTATLKGPNAEEFIRRVGCGNSSDPISCLKMKSPIELQIPTQVSDKLTFVPAVDGDFLSESPERILFGNNQKSSAARQFYASLDILSGVNNFDGALSIVTKWPFILGYTDINHPRITRDQLDNIIITDAVDTALSPKDNYTRNLLQKFATVEYTNWTAPDSFISTRTSTVAVSGDVGFFSPAIRAANAHASMDNGRTYFYEFSVDIDHHNMATPDWIKGSVHTDDVPFVFCKPLNGSATQNYTESDKRVSRAVATMWSNFARSGNPNMPDDVMKYIHTTWPEYSLTSQQYFQMSYQMSASSVNNHFYARRMAFWSELIKEMD